MAVHQENPVNFTVGLSTDTTPLNQPKGSYRFALNSVMESREGTLGTISNEEGNVNCGEFPDGYYPIGDTILTNNDILYFLRDDEGNSEIGLKSSNCQYTTIINNPCLNFNNQIESTFKILNGCDRIIYFVDNDNPDRVVNIDNILRNPTSHAYLDSDGNFDCSLIKLKPDLKVACVTNVDINNTGGNLPLGVYEIILQYEDTFGNQTDYFYGSTTIPIVNGNYSTDYTKIIGGDSGFPDTTKSIKIDIENIDLNYAFINIVVGQTINQVTSYYKLDRLSIINDTLVYVITTIDTDAAEAVVLDDIIISNNPYDTSKTITQIDNRLIRGGLKSNVVDYSKFQIEANNIQVKYTWEDIPISNSNDDAGSSKSSTYYFDYKSYMRDEIYSLGIVWILKDNTELPVMHIPGRLKNTKSTGLSFPTSDTNIHTRPNNFDGYINKGWDSAYIVASDVSGTNILPDFKHFPNTEFITGLNPLVPNQKYIERWKAYNTAFKESNGSGELAYYESIYDYPNTLNCDGDRIYPEGKIRHHKMPDTTLELHYGLGGVTIRPLGLVISNIVPPAEYANDVQGYYIVREKRDLINKTIVDKGIVFRNSYFRIVEFCDEDTLTEYQVQNTTYNLHRFKENLQLNPPFGIIINDGIIPNYSEADRDCGSTGFRDLDGNNDATLSVVENFLQYDDKSQSFHGPVSKFKKQQINANLFKAEKLLIGLITEHSDEPVGGSNISRVYNSADYSLFSANPSFTNRQFKSNPVYIDSDETAPQGILTRQFLNDNQQETLVVETLDDLDSSLFTNNGYRDTDTTSAYYGSLKSFSNTIYGQLNTRTYYKVSNCLSLDSSITVYGGDTFITKFSFMKTSFNKMCVGQNNTYVNDNGPCGRDESNGISAINSLEKNLVTYIVESEINTELRHYDINDLENTQNTFYPFYSGTINEFLGIDWNGETGDKNADCGVDPDDEGGGGGFAPWACDTFMKNLYLYNLDYSKEETTKPYISLDTNYDYCKTCQEEFPNRITYSEQSFQEDRNDNYRLFQANNYRDLPSIHGNLTKLITNNNKLFAITEKTPMVIFTKPYQLQGDQDTLYVGTGEFFAIPPNELISTQYGYGGSTQQWGFKSTEFGVTYIDDVTGKVLMIGENISDIGLQGERNWFEENIPLNFPTQFKELFNTDYTVPPAFPNGIGYLITYDPRYKRIIVTKKDYNIIGDLESVDNIDFSDVDMFENVSWTKSYSMLTNSWVSYHSYLPRFYSNDSNNFYSFIDNNIWKHDKNNFQTYYGIKYDHILDYVNNTDGATKSINTLNYISNVDEYDSVNKEWVDKDLITYDRLNIYTNKQSTGLQPITVKTSPFASVTTTGVLASKVESDWKISNIRDYVIDRTINPFTRNWTNLQTDYFIDKVINPLAVSSNKSVFELEDIRDKYCNIRLYFQPEDDLRITTTLIQSNNNISIR
jgi:hypothetical protein